MKKALERGRTRKKTKKQNNQRSCGASRERERERGEQRAERREREEAATAAARTLRAGIPRRSAAARPSGCVGPARRVGTLRCRSQSVRGVATRASGGREFRAFRFRGAPQRTRRVRRRVCRTPWFEPRAAPRARRPRVLRSSNTARRGGRRRLARRVEGPQSRANGPWGGRLRPSVVLFAA